MTGVLWLWLLLAAAVGAASGYGLSRFLLLRRREGLLAEAQRILEESAREAEARQKEILLEGKEEVHRLRAEAEREIRERRAELGRMEKRLLQKEEALDKKLAGLERKEGELEEQKRKLEALQAEIEELRQRQVAELESLAELTREQAREMLLNQVKEESRREAALIQRSIETEAREQAEEKAREIIAEAVQRYAAEHVAELAISVVELPSEEMKGRIIGREGRNIRTFETLTGVDLIIDDSPEAVTISAFDPIRREKARLTLEKLVADGRIHPGRIEEMYARADREVEQAIKEAGEQAALETGVSGLHPELVRLLGSLKYRTSYGQNVLKHSVEVAHLSGLMASQLGVNVALAKRAGLLHDIGKAVDHSVEGTHVELGMEMLRRYGESEEVIHAISAHHGEYEARSVEAVLVTAADALSASRPGARRETLEAYIQRLKKLEEIASSFPGVAKSYAIHAGREVRVIVKPEEVDDAEAYRMAKEIARKVQDEVRFPGQIKVTVIRETRAEEYAR